MLVTSHIGECQLAREAAFAVPSHIHVCVTGNGAVILDLKRDKYLGLGRAETELLAAAVPNWPKSQWEVVDGGTAVAARQLATRELCEALAADGVLERGGERVDGARPRCAVEELGDMRAEWISIGDELEVAGRMTLRHMVRFLSAYLWVRWSLAWRPLSVVVDTVRADKVRGRRAVEHFHAYQVAALIDVFRRLRTFAFAAEGRCLLHALTLTRFLSKYGFYPEWVIGVTTQPWGAHSWVQWGNFLLDSNPEKVCTYSPIMRV
jgi:hypothetical protein